MTQHICPNCSKKGFVWSIQDESPYTQWWCSCCSYHAEEDEELEKECEKCKTKNNMLMRSDDDYFFYCTNCQAKTKEEVW